MSASADKKIGVSLLLDLRMQELTGTLTRDWAKAHHTNPTLTGTSTWVSVNGAGCVSLNSANPDYAQIATADCADLNFTSGAFSGCMWVNITTLVTSYLMDRGTPNGFGANGWTFLFFNSSLSFYTSQGIGAWQKTDAAYVFPTGIWHFVGFTRSGASVRLYINGVDKTSAPAVHVDPAASARNLVIGADYDYTSPVNGQIQRPRIWGRCLAPEEMFYLWQTERRRFGA